ncbi:hypothetical protein [Levilactobacillus suantsaiihabitans]|uniref:D-alanyl-D-alanine carboxypeptidase n=1 Tax=Levilactobacillus suantsaiihabitans TaxID=2487722 RepID=A0A4Z0J6T5_9LACO|nr:hypothetical protein [Levilactobacillus suantsaiihabitans]TGD17802.1 hypothetical protein EGT51_10990 [Levilactobacillus suantsaiihabitans]
MRVKTVLVAALALVTMGATAAETVPAQAKTRVLQTKKMKKRAYKVSGGYFYKNTKLKKRVHKASKYLRTNFYTYKSAKIRKSNGKVVKYYYVKNKAGNVKGWVWHKNLVKQPTYSRQKKDIAAMKKIVMGMSQEVQDNALGMFVHMSYKAAYHDGASGRDLYHVIDEMGYLDANNPADIQGVIQTYRLFKGRYGSDEKEILDSYNDLDDALNGRNGEEVVIAVQVLRQEIDQSIATFGN